MKNILGVIAVVSMLFSCSSIKVITDYDKTVDFSQYKSLEYYGWADNSDSILNRFDKERIENSFGVEFQKRGLSLAEKGQGDIVVSLHIVTQEKTQKTATTQTTGVGYGGYGRYYGYGPGYGYGTGYSTTTVNEYDYVVGTLMISIYDAEKEELIWETIGIGTINEKPEKREREIPKSAAQMMMNYPVKPLDGK